MYLIIYYFITYYLFIADRTGLLRGYYVPNLIAPIGNRV